MNSKIIDSLFRLLNQCIPENIPVQVLRLAVHFFKSLVNGDRTDWNRTIANDPFTGAVNILPGRQIHQRIGTPFGRPTHLLHFLLDGRCHRRVTDIGVYLNEKVSTNRHRF